MDMSELTAFQEKCGDEFKKVLRDLGCEFRKWEIIKGREQTYIQVDLGRIQAWIYTDGADWKGCGRDRVYEAPDYDSLDDLQRAFIDEVSAVLAQR